jgi:hypothetical protein
MLAIEKGGNAYAGREGGVEGEIEERRYREGRKWEKNRERDTYSSRGNSASQTWGMDAPI